MEIYKIIGFSEFTFEDHPGVVWMSLFCVYERKNTQGLATEKINVRRENIVGGAVELNRKCKAYYNKYGKVASVELLDEE